MSGRYTGTHFIRADRSGLNIRVGARVYQGEVLSDQSLLKEEETLLRRLVNFTEGCDLHSTLWDFDVLTQFSDQTVIRDETMNIMIAGSDTVSRFRRITW